MARTRLRDCDDWFTLWREDHESITECMMRNMAADIQAGYSYASIKKQQAQIEQYDSEWKNQMYQFAEWDDRKVNRWCYYDMLKRGAID